MLFSMIVPVYNAENTLVRCLESIASQTYFHYEVIMIDDGSTDRSAEIAAQYAKRDSRFHLFRQGNAGVSAVRNRGMELAKGDIIVFADSDDFIEPEYFETIHEAFLKENAEIVFYGARRITESKELVATMHMQKWPDSYEEQLIALTRADAFGYTWIKAIRKEVARTTNFRENLQPFEDEIFSCEIMEKRPAIAHVDRILYNQVIVPGSLSRRAYLDYYQKCEAVYLAWKRLLTCMQIKEHPVLREKANRMAIACKYYMLEKNIPVWMFARKTAVCTFMIESTVDDKMVCEIRKKRFGIVFMMNMICRCKNFVRKLKHR